MPQAQTLQKQKQQWNAVKKTLRSQFQFKDLRPGQEEIIRSVLAGKNTLAIMPTGGGKSLCYQLPALHLSGTTVVISPLISLMKDQREKLEDKGIAAVELNSAISEKLLAENLEKATNEDAEVIYVTPERFSNPEFLKTLKETEIDFVVIDEAHCVSQWGHDFRPAYLGIGESLAKLGRPPVLALTATATDEVAEDIQKQLGLKEMAVFRTGVMRENLQLEARYLSTPQEKLEALATLVEEMKGQSGIIYTATVKAAKEVQDFLIEKGIASTLYHGKLTPKEREASQDKFMSPGPTLMIATNAFGMGIDKSDIRFVIHFQFPGSLEAYYQESGRAGRDAEPARCILLYLKRDKSTQSLFLSGKYPTAEEVAQTYQVLQARAERKEPLDRKILEEKLGEIIGKRKIAVIFSLLKQLKIVKETKKSGVALAKANLHPEEVTALAKVYQERQERDKAKLNQVIIYAQSALCRWRHILQYFNEPVPTEPCAHCDNCLKPERGNLERRLEELKESTEFEDPSLSAPTM